jgi:hypothetical protein
MPYPSDADPAAADALCAQVWDEIAKECQASLSALENSGTAWDEDTTAWAKELLDTIVHALRQDRLERLRRQNVVSLSEYRQAMHGDPMP